MHVTTFTNNLQYLFQIALNFEHTVTSLGDTILLAIWFPLDNIKNTILTVITNLIQLRDVVTA